MAESFPEGSAILDAMSCQVENGYVVAPTKPGFGHSLQRRWCSIFNLPEGYNATTREVTICQKKLLL